ncbi:hypothetical protein ACFROC_04995 [Nocardia tengchongensis]|uniref:hypothetical protein n=1 Tax=Nocardia tengchongensis TaxID=2055889 RepID=UPI0036C4EEF0
MRSPVRTAAMMTTVVAGMFAMGVASAAAEPTGIPVEVVQPDVIDSNLGQIAGDTGSAQALNLGQGSFGCPIRVYPTCL